MTSPRLVVTACLLLLWGCKGSEELGQLVTPSAAEGLLVIPVRIHLGQKVPVERAKAALGATQRFIAGCGLSLRQTGSAQRIALEALFSTRLEPAAQGVEKGVVWDALRETVTRLAPPQADGVQLVLLEALSTPGSVAQRALGPLHGLGLRPGDPALADVGLSENFRPIVFSRPEAVTIAHELGHALGLDHVALAADRPTNLMSRSVAEPDACRLDGSQLRVIKAHLKRMWE